MSSSVVNQMTPQEIREILRSWVLRYMEHSPSDVLIDELCFIDRKRRADLVHANGQLVAFEVKSHADTLRRWPEQQADYLRVFDEIWLCCHWTHAAKALSISSRQTGLLIVDDNQNIAMLRPAKANRKSSLFEQTDFLWRSELDSLCQENGLDVPRKLRIKDVRAFVVDQLPAESIKSHILTCLKARYRMKDYGEAILPDTISSNSPSSN